MAATSGIVWSAPPQRITARVAALGVAFAGAVDQLARLTALEGERYAKAQAPWANRTGAARATLSGASTVSAMSGEVTISHGVDYGIWLEVAHGRAYGVLPATVDHMVGVLDQGLDGLLGRVTRGVR